MSLNETAVVGAVTPVVSDMPKKFPVVFCAASKFSMRDLASLMQTPTPNVVDHCQFVFWLFYRALFENDGSVFRVVDKPNWTTRPFRPHTKGQLFRSSTEMALFWLCGNMASSIWCTTEIGIMPLTSYDDPLDAMVEQVGRALARVSAYRSPRWIALATNIKQWMDTGVVTSVEEHRFLEAERHGDVEALTPVMIYSGHYSEPESAEADDAERPTVCSPPQLVKRGVKRGLDDEEGPAEPTAAAGPALARVVRRAAKRSRFFATFAGEVVVHEIPCRVKPGAADDASTAKQEEPIAEPPAGSTD